MNQTIELSLNNLVADHEYQPRYGGGNGLAPEHLERLRCSDVADWPPLLVTPAGEGAGYFIIDGFHRYQVAKEKKLQSVRCLVVENAGKPEAFAANLKHGLPLTNEDRKEFARWLHKHQPGLSQYDIAHKSGLAQPTISKLLRKQASDSRESLDGQRKQASDSRESSSDALRQLLLFEFAQFFSGKSDARQRAETIKTCLESYEEAEQATMREVALTIGQALVDGANLLAVKGKTPAE